MGKDIIIKRYMNFENYVRLLNDGLFCPKSSLFEDWWEGLIAHPEKTEDEEYISNFAKAREWIYVSCWHKESAESYAMWKIYGGHQHSVCIQTTKDKVEQLFRSDLDLPSEIISCEVLYLRPNENEARQRPAYSELRESNVILQNKPHLSVYASQHGIKHEGYTYEHEYRIIIMDDKITLKFQNELRGTTLKIVPKEIIDEVYVSPSAPDWYYKIVSDISCKYGYSRKIKKSSLVKNPAPRAQGV